MTKPLTKEELIRGTWITELRRQGDRQCEGKLLMGTRVCALGLLSEIADIHPSLELYSLIADAAGLSDQQLDEVWRMNDGDQHYGPPLHKHTFSEIADVVEGWFKKSNEGVGALASRTTHT